MLTNCFRFAPRDSVPGLIAKICKYLKDHPGWSEAELEEQIKQFIGQTGVESFNGRTGAVVLNENDVNNLKIASAYFAEGDETIDDLDIVALYNQGVRFVFTNWNSVTSGYDLSFVLDYFSGSNDVVYYPMSTGSGGGGNIVSVNGKTGIVELSLSDILGDSGAQVKLCTATEFTSITLNTWNAYYEEGYRVVGVVNSDASAIDYIYLLKQDENNHQPIGLSTGASDAYTPTNPPPYPVLSVNGKTGAVTGLYSAENPPPYPVTSVNGKTGAVTGLYSAENPPPYPVTSVNGKTGDVTGLYNSENQPPYPVTSVMGSTGVVNAFKYGNLYFNTDRIEPNAYIRGYNGTSDYHTDLFFTDTQLQARYGDNDDYYTIYDRRNQPPYPVLSVDGKTGAVTTYNIVNLDPYIPNPSFTMTRGFNILRLVRVIDAGSSIPAGNTSTRTATISVPYALNILGLSLQNSARDCQCTAYIEGTTIGFTVTNHSGEGTSVSDIFCNMFVFVDADSLTVTFNGG